jgi:hypothetical protein
MNEQLKENINFYKNQNFIMASNILQDEGVRAAREIVYNILENREFEDWDSWSESERRAASKVCSSYCTVAVFIQNELVTKEIILKTWKDNIIRNYLILKKYIEFMQKNRFGPTYWSEIDWLYHEVETRYPESVEAFKNKPH